MNVGSCSFPVVPVATEGVAPETLQKPQNEPNKLECLQQRIQGLKQQIPTIVCRNLKDSDLPEEIRDPLVRAYVVFGFNSLKAACALSVLEGEDSVYYTDRLRRIHVLPPLQDICQGYFSQPGTSLEKFDKIITYIRALTNYNLNDLYSLTLEEEKAQVVVQAARARIEEKKAIHVETK